MSKEAKLGSISLMVREEDGSIVLDHKQVDVDDINRVFKDHPNREDYKYAIRQLDSAFNALNAVLETSLGIDSETVPIFSYKI